MRSIDPSALEDCAAHHRARSSKLDAMCAAFTKKSLEDGVLPPETSVWHENGMWASATDKGPRVLKEDLLAAVQFAWNRYIVEQPISFPRWHVGYLLEAEVDPHLRKRTKLWLTLDFTDWPYPEGQFVRRSKRIEVGSMAKAYLLVREHWCKVAEHALNLINEMPGAEKRQDPGTIIV